MTRLHSSKSPVASILILSYQHPDLVTDCLASIARSTDPDATPYEVIVLFQQSNRETVERLLEDIEGIRALCVRLNLGFGGGMNFAAKHAKGRYLVFLNDDSEAHPDWLRHLVSTAETRANIGCVGSRILFTDGTLQEAGGIIWSDGSTMPVGRGERAGSLAFSYFRKVDYTSANAMLVRRDDFDRLGGFDERYFPAYYEDVDLCLALRHRLKREIVYEPRSVISHIEAASSVDPDFRAFLFQRNQRTLAEKWHAALPSYQHPQPRSASAVEDIIWRQRGGGTRVLVVDDRLPDAGGEFGGVGSGFGRTRELLQDLRECAVTLYPTHRPRRNTLADLGIDVIDEPLDQHLARAGKTYDAVIISRPHNVRAFAKTIRSTMPNVPLIYDAEALYHRRLWLQASLETSVDGREIAEARAREMEQVESDIARSVDRIVVISPEERAWLESVEGHAPLDFMPLLISGIEMSPGKLDGRNDAVYIAGWLGGAESPNVDAAQWYYKEVLPRVRAALPAFRTLVTGKNPPVAVQALASEAFVLTGFVESLRNVYYGARVAIVPMRAGAGIKTKTVEALQFGVPVVTTSVGADGLGLRDGIDADVTDDPKVFVERVVALMTDDALWLRRRESLEAWVRAWESRRLSWREVLARTSKGEARSYAM